MSGYFPAAASSAARASARNAFLDAGTRPQSGHSTYPSASMALMNGSRHCGHFRCARSLLLRCTLMSE